MVLVVETSKNSKLQLAVISVQVDKSERKCAGTHLTIELVVQECFGIVMLLKSGQKSAFTALDRFGAGVNRCRRCNWFTICLMNKEISKGAPNFGANQVSREEVI